MYLGRYINISVSALASPAPSEAPSQPSQQWINNDGYAALSSLCDAIKSRPQWVL